MHTNDCDILAQIEARISSAERRYGDFASTHEALGVALEEWDELRDAIKRNVMYDVQAECIDLAAVLIRLARGVRDDLTFRKRSTK